MCNMKGVKTYDILFYINSIITVTAVSVVVCHHCNVHQFFTNVSCCRLIFPNSQRMNRGGYEMSHLIRACRANEVTDFIVVHEHRGVPDSLVSLF